MRRLAQPEVLKAAALAASATAALCGPSLLLWAARPYPVWYLEAILFLGGIVLWAFVFAWHTHYTGRPVFLLRIEPASFAAATVAGILVAAALTVFLDPSLRSRTPQDYPADVQQWVAMTLFHLMFIQLFLVFAPLAWLMRLARKRSIAVVLTVALGVVVLMIKNHSSTAPAPPALFAALLVARIILGALAVYFYWRGGVMLAWWWGFLIQARHLFHLGAS